MFGGHGVTSQTIPMRKVYKETEAGQTYIQKFPKVWLLYLAQTVHEHKSDLEK